MLCHGGSNNTIGMIGIALIWRREHGNNNGKAKTNGALSFHSDITVGRTDADRAGEACVGSSL